MSATLAPVVVFAYNRPLHLRRALDALVLVREELLHPGATRSTRQGIELAVGVLFVLMRQLLGSGWRAQRVCFVHAAPQDNSLHLQLFGPRVDFGHEFNGIATLASELDTRLVMRPLRNTERVLKNAAVDRLLDKEKTLGAQLKFEDIIDEVAGVYPKIMREGTMEAGAWSCGMVAGLIHDIPTVQELMDRIMGEADTIIRQRLAGFAAA